MRHKPYSEPNDAEKYPWYQDWMTTAEAEKQRAQDAHDNELEYEFKSRIWGQVKDYLFEYFDGKCAYCESKVLHISSGDVEHYAPKSKVKDDPEHPGYYWLAYDLRNLLPSCEKCNRAGGKMNQFPVVKGLTAHAYEAFLGADKPLLLHPYYIENLSSHLAFTPPDIETGLFSGMIVGLTDEGTKTIETCNLNREPLVERRRELQRAYFDEVLANTMRINLENALADVRSGKKEYSAALKVVVKAYWEYVKNAMSGVASDDG